MGTSFVKASFTKHLQRRTLYSSEDMLAALAGQCWIRDFSATQKRQQVDIIRPEPCMTRDY